MPTAEHALEVDSVLKKLLKGPKTRKQLGVTRYKLGKLMADKLVKSAGEVKPKGSTHRRAVTYELMAKGKRRAEKLAAS
jgi:hypothetical protein